MRGSAVRIRPPAPFLSNFNNLGLNHRQWSGTIRTADHHKRLEPSGRSPRARWREAPAIRPPAPFLSNFNNLGLNHRQWSGTIRTADHHKRLEPSGRSPRARWREAPAIRPPAPFPESSRKVIAHQAKDGARFEPPTITSGSNRAAARVRWSISESPEGRFVLAGRRNPSVAPISCLRPLQAESERRRMAAFPRPGRAGCSGGGRASAFASEQSRVATPVHARCSGVGAAFPGRGETSERGAVQAAERRNVEDNAALAPTTTSLPICT